MFRTKCVPLKIVYGADVSAVTPFLSFTEYLLAFHAVAQAFSLADESVEETCCWYAATNDVGLLLSLSKRAPSREYEKRREA